jgi:hypothetical protein
LWEEDPTEAARLERKTSKKERNSFSRLLKKKLRRQSTRTTVSGKFLQKRSKEKVTMKYP